MPKPAPADRPRARSGQGGTAPGVLVDDLAAERNSPPLPPEPVFTIDLVEAEAGKRGRRYVAELEELARRNALAATEARGIALEQRRHLEETAKGRLAAEREISRLRRDLSVAVAEQARLAALKTEPRPAIPADGNALHRMREAVEEQQRLIGEHRDRLVGALRERDEARLEARRAAEARDRAERSLAATSEMLQRRAAEDAAASEPSEARADDATTQVLTARVAELEAEVAHGALAREELSLALADLDAARAETARLEDRAVELEQLVAIARDETAAARAEAATARDELTRVRADSDAAGAANAELRERTSMLEATADAAAQDRDTAWARVEELERLLTAASEDGSAARDRAVEVEEQLARAEERAAAWTNAASEARDALRESEEARAEERQRAQVQLDRLAGRLAELEEMVLRHEPPPPVAAEPSPALEELGRLAAPVPEPAPEGEGDVSDQAGLRRSLLADLSDLAHGIDSP